MNTLKTLPGFISFIFVLAFIYLMAMCEAEKQPDRSPCDTLTVTPGKAQQIIVRRSKDLFHVHANFIVIEDSTGKVLALKSKDGWQIVDAGAALEVLIADLEVCKQSK